ncbi:MAG: amidohydrolase [Anaerocolumna sp.]
MIDLKKEASVILDKAIEIRRDFHMHPEPSQSEKRTADIVAKHLETLGMEVRRDYAGELPSVVGFLKGGYPGKTVALRADMDALRFQEKNKVPYCSTVDGIMHACGHDCHTAMLICAAEILANHREELHGNVKFIFEPAEEDIGGAKFMVLNGVLKDPKVDAIFGLHVENMYPIGNICISYGEMQAASDRLVIQIKGKSAHGAHPHKGIDAILIASHFLVAVQTMMAREKDTFQHAVITFGQIHGGTARNIVCDNVTLNGICRTLNPEMRDFLNQRIEGLLKGITEAFGGSYELERQRSFPALYCTSELTDFVASCAQELIGKDHIEEMPHAVLGCESFAYYTQKVPGAYFWLGSGNPEQGITAPLHTEYFDIDERCMITGIAMHTAMAFQYLNQEIKETL